MDPNHLTGLARTYFDRHYARLVDAGILTDADHEAFILLCQLWQRVGETGEAARSDPKRNRTFLDTVKAYQSLARQFGLLPLERKRAGVQLVPEQLDEFGL